MAIHQLVAGVHNFQGNVFRTQHELFQRLSKEQSPETLFITCSNSRIDPNLITQTDPDDLFVLRNAGNIVRAYFGTAGGETATIEFAITGLGVKQIVVCGHSHCGAIKGLLNPDQLEDMPAVRDWLKHAEATRRIVKSKYKNRPKEELVEVAAEENVLTQLENLQTHPAVAVALSQGELSLHAWMYEIETGEVDGYHTTVGQFIPLGQLRSPANAAPARVHDVRTGDGLFRGSGSGDSK